MTDDLSGVMEKLGRLDEKADAAEKKRDEICAEIHAINAKLAEFDRLRQRGWGILAGVALAGGGLSAGISKWLGH